MQHHMNRKEKLQALFLKQLSYIVLFLSSTAKGFILPCFTVVIPLKLPQNNLPNLCALHFITTLEMMMPSFNKLNYEKLSLTENILIKQKDYGH